MCATDCGGSAGAGAGYTGRPFRDALMSIGGTASPSPRPKHTPWWAVALAVAAVYLVTR